MVAKVSKKRHWWTAWPNGARVAYPSASSRLSINFPKYRSALVATFGSAEPAPRSPPCATSAVGPDTISLSGAHGWTVTLPHDVLAGWLAATAVDMRTGIDGLSLRVSTLARSRATARLTCLPTAAARA